MPNLHAEHIWINGRIETLDDGFAPATALAIGHGTILAVGSDAAVSNLSGPGTVLHDLNGRFVMPGLVESHSHALWGACRDLFDVFVGYRAGFEQLLAAVGERTAIQPPGTFIIGGPWRLDMRKNMGPRPRDILDAVAPDHPVALQDVTQHSLWCNSCALELAGLNADSAEPAGGVIERDQAGGAPSGILAEAACRPVRKLMVRTQPQLEKASRHFCRYFNSMGITAFKEPMAFEADLAAYKAADERGDLTLHMAAHLTRSSPLAADDISYDDLEEWRHCYATQNLRTGFAKLFLDGVAPSHTASFLQPYLETSGYDAATHDPDATLLIGRNELMDTVSELDRRGFVTKMHAVGDNAVRVGLDAIAAARGRNGNSGLRHEIAHCPFVHAEDFPRFAELGAVAEMSPKLWFPNPVTAAQARVLGRDRVEACHSVRSLLEAGAELTYASDWPAAAPDANPWTGLAGMISRSDPTGAYEGTVGADQAISLRQALPLFTTNGARSLRMESETGTLSVGKWADFIVLERPLDTMTPAEIGAVEPIETWWKGRRVFHR